MIRQAPESAGTTTPPPATQDEPKTKRNIGLLGGTFITLLAISRIIRRRQLLRARAEPAPGSEPASFDQLKARLKEMCPPESAFQWHEEGDRFVMTWQLHGIPWATLLFRRKLRETQALELKPGGTDGRTVFVRYRQGRIEWETAAATWMPKAKVAWAYPSRFDAGPVHDPADSPPVPTADSPRTFSELVRHVRPIVLRASFRYEPVLHFPH